MPTPSKQPHHFSPTPPRQNALDQTVETCSVLLPKNIHINYASEPCVVSGICLYIGEYIKETTDAATFEIDIN